MFAVVSPDKMTKAVDELKQSVELVSRLALRCPNTPEMVDLRLEALTDLCIAARQLADDEVFCSLLDMALLHASNRLYAANPEQMASVIATAQGPRAGDAGANI
ncbi:hypothetical protein [Bradyrhizobium prioriisuperbiae]|uniref:hypothetical protein n=1 Tax=Bradyrhizobium prioriisuperbiae TaxID=2854389 RepID=UPI0028E41E60|nr:hypothetical protein [Bradyrhizobium prioritasuperba]